MAAQNLASISSKPVISSHAFKFISKFNLDRQEYIKFDFKPLKILHLGLVSPLSQLFIQTMY